MSYTDWHFVKVATCLSIESHYVSVPQIAFMFYYTLQKMILLWKTYFKFSFHTRAEEEGEKEAGGKK